VSKSADVLRSVPAAILVENRGPFSGGRSAILRSSPAAQALAIVGYELELAGLGAAIQNMWLAANALGLSAVFLGDIAVGEPAIRDRLELSGDLLGALAMGFLTEAPEGSNGTPPPAALDPDLVRWATGPR
jgi:nitroreductase